MHLPPPQLLDIQLPHGAEGDGGSTSSSASSSVYHLIDQLQCMQERAQVCSDYLMSDRSSLHGIIITPEDRRKLCTWSFVIVELFRLDKEVACIAITYLDRFMATTTSSRRAKKALLSHVDYYQLVMVTCLFIALKCRAGLRVGADVFADTVCNGLYTMDEIASMEIEILHALNWKLNGPSSHEFVDAMVGLLPTTTVFTDLWSKLVIKAKKYLEAASLDYDMALQPSSFLASAALLTSLQEMDLLDTFQHMELLIDWATNVMKSIMSECFIMRRFLKGLTKLIRIKCTSALSFQVVCVMCPRNHAITRNPAS